MLPELIRKNQFLAGYLNINDMIKKIILVTALLCAVLSSCENTGDGIPVKPSGAKHYSNFEIEFLFEADGVKVYRFYDGGRNVYFTNTKGDVFSNHNEGKITVEDQTICNKQ